MSAWTNVLPVTKIAIKFAPMVGPRVTVWEAAPLQLRAGCILAKPTLLLFLTLCARGSESLACLRTGSSALGALGLATPAVSCKPRGAQGWRPDKCPLLPLASVGVHWATSHNGTIFSQKYFFYLIIFYAMEVVHCTQSFQCQS